MAAQTLVQELYIDLTSPRPLEPKVEITILGDLRNDPFSVADNCVLSDPDIAIEELIRFKAAGGCTIVDPTTVGIGG